MSLKGDKNICRCTNSFLCCVGQWIPLSIDCISVEVDQTREPRFCQKRVKRDDFEKRNFIKLKCGISCPEPLMPSLLSSGGSSAGLDASWKCEQRGSISNNEQKNRSEIRTKLWSNRVGNEGLRSPLSVRRIGPVRVRFTQDLRRKPLVRRSHSEVYYQRKKPCDPTNFKPVNTRFKCFCGSAVGGGRWLFLSNTVLQQITRPQDIIEFISTDSLACFKHIGPHLWTKFRRTYWLFLLKFFLWSF